jgi:hypothetical protein
MRAFLFLFLMIGLVGCAPTYFLSFSNGYDPATSYINSLPTIILNPGQSRPAFLPVSKPALLPESSVKIASEDPKVVVIWKPFRPGDIIRIQAVAPGNTIVHRGNFPFPMWQPDANPVVRQAWRAAVRRHLRPRPDNAAFRAMSDAEIWKTVLRSRSTGALRVMVEKDRLDFQAR